MTSLATASPLADMITATLEKDGTLQSVRTALKAQVFKQLSRAGEGKENSASLSNLNKMNQVKSDERCGRSLSLVFDLLNTMGLHQTASLLKTEIGTPVLGSVSRTTLAMELGMSADSDELPLMFQVMDAINNNTRNGGSPKKMLTEDTNALAATISVSAHSSPETLPGSAAAAVALSSSSSSSSSPPKPESASPPTQGKRESDVSRNSPRVANAKTSSPMSSPKASPTAAFSPSKSLESAFDESIEESIDSVKTSPNLSPVKPSTAVPPAVALSLPLVNVDSGKDKLSPERKPLTPSSSPSKSPQTKLSPSSSEVLKDAEKEFQSASQTRDDKDPYTNYQNLLDSSEFKSATADRLENASSGMEEKDGGSLSPNSDDNAYHEAMSRSLEEAPQEEDSPDESFATAGSYAEVESDEMERMQSSSLQGRDDVDVARVTKVQVGPSTVGDREETEESGLSRANVTKLGSGRPSRLSRSSAGWNVASPNSSARDDGPDSFDLPSSSPTSSPSQRSSSQPESKRSSPGLKNVSSGGNITNLSDSFELEELGHSDSSRSPRDEEEEKPSNQEEEYPRLNRHLNSKKGWGASPSPRARVDSEGDFELEESFDSGDAFDDDDDDDDDFADFESGKRSTVKGDEDVGVFLSRTKSGAFQGLPPRQSSPASSPPKDSLRDADEQSNADSEVNSLDEDIDDFEDDFELESPVQSSKPKPSIAATGGFSRIESKPTTMAPNPPAAAEQSDEEEDDYADDLDDFEKADESPRAKQLHSSNNDNDNNDDLIIEDDLDEMSVGEDLDESEEW